MPDDTDDAELLKKVIRVVIEHREANTRLLQRELGLSYGKACKMIDKMEEIGVITEPRKITTRIVIPRNLSYGLWLIDNPMPGNEPPTQ